MKSESLLLDTHALIWYDQDDKIPKGLRKLFESENTTIFVSSLSTWEIAIKYNLGKLEEAKKLILSFERTLATYGFIELPFTIRHSLMAGALPIEHKDLFDRALIAQAVTEKLTLVTTDAQIHKAVSQVTGLKILWE